MNAEQGSSSETTVAIAAQAARTISSADLEYVDAGSINTELFCSICNHVFLDAVQTPCEHYFCLACVRTWIDGGKSTCPLCRSSGLSVQTLRPCRLLNNLTDQLLVLCPYGCGPGWQGKRHTLSGHLEHCEECPVQCPNATSGCKTVVARKAVAAHLTACSYKAVQCECGATVAACLLEAHKQEECAAQPCPHGCSTRVAPSRLQQHEERCPAVEIACRGAAIGCTFTGRRAAVTEHGQTCVYERLRPTLQVQHDLLEAQSELLAKQRALLEDQSLRIETLTAALFPLTTAEHHVEMLLTSDFCHRTISSFVGHYSNRSKEIKEQPRLFGSLTLVSTGLKALQRYRATQDSHTHLALACVCLLTAAEPNAAFFAQCRGVALLLSMFEEREEDLELMQYACWAILNLARFEPNRNELCKRGAVRLLFRCMDLHTNSAMLCERALLALQAICQTPDCRLTVAFPHGLERIAAIIAEHLESSTVVVAGLIALFEASRGIEACISALREPAVRQIVLEARKYHQETADVVEACDHVLHLRE